MVTISESKHPQDKQNQWGEKSLTALSTQPHLSKLGTKLRGLPIISAIFVVIEMILVRFWIWVHNLPLPDWMLWMLNIMDGLLEIVITVISDIISWIVGRPEAEDKKKEINGKKTAKVQD